MTVVLPGAVALDPTKRYYISVLPGDAANPFEGSSPIGHGMGGAPIPSACSPVPPSTTCTGTFRRDGAYATLALSARQTLGVCLRR